jgi:UDP-2,4-diacetamido-2,4,6-trideoxy-beta-L-altropyranose hydrolase
MLLIRCDANSAIGAGHFFRELALAEAAADRGISIAFAMHRPSEAFEGLADASGVELVTLEEDAGSLEDAAETRKIAEERGAAAVVVDGYHFNTAFYEMLSVGQFTLAAVDDIAHQYFPVDVLINVNPHADKLSYNVPTDAQLLLGVKYALLRRQFREARTALDEQSAPEVSASVSRLLVTMGGADPTSETEKVIRALCATDYTGRVDVVVGPANSNLEQLKAIATRASADICFHSNVRQMASLMQSQHMAICAAGGTSWELACLGIPMLQMVVADNQEPIAQWLADGGYADMLGWRDDVSPQNIASQFEALAQAPQRRATIADSAMKLIDGRGPDRILQVLTEKQHT